MEELKFLKVKVEKHPTRDFDLEYLDHHSAVGVLILDEFEEKVLLVKQYRPGVRGELYEIPAGLIDEGESAVEAMYREVEEETGYIKEHFELIYKPEKSLFISPGYTTENLSIFILKLKSNGVEAKEKKLDESEDLSTHWIDIDRVGEISLDFKTHFAISLNKNRSK